MCNKKINYNKCFSLSTDHQPEKMESNFMNFPFSGTGGEMNQHMFMSSTHHHALNPIDRLYSMQNSYFCGEDANHMEQ